MPDDHLFWQFNEGQLKQAVLQNNWKLVRFKKKDEAEILELYDLSKDISEQHNLATRYPQKVKALRSLMKESVSRPANTAFDWTDLHAIGELLPSPALLNFTGGIDEKH